MEVAALNTYSKAQAQLVQATGDILSNHKIVLNEAMKGTVSRRPTALPVLDVPNGGGSR